MRIWIPLTVLLFGGAAMAQTTQPAEVPRYGLFETAIDLDGQFDTVSFDNPFRDVILTATFTAPSGATVKVEGFYDGQRTWRVRFVPREEGKWKYSISAANAARPIQLAQPAKGEGTFECKGTAGRGFLRLSKRNAFRMEYEDGTPFYPIGIQTCGFLRPDFDGPGPDGKWRNVDNEEWLKAFAGAVNLVRTQFGQGTRAGCALALIPEPPKPATAPASASAPAPVRPPIDRYDLDLAKRIDEAYKLHRQAGMSQILILYQDMSLWGGGGSGFGGGRDLTPKGYKNLQAANLPMQEQYIRYIVARWGAFVDIWELFNEDSYAPDDYLAHLAGVVRKADPYGHITTTNYARPRADWCQVVTFHEYMGMPPNQVDAYLCQLFALYKSYGKVVQNTEFGNQGQLSNYDPVKWRIAVWTAFMNECGLLFWGMSGSKVAAGRPNAQGNANAYIGPDSRQHFRVLNEFTRDLPIDLRPVAIGYHEHTDIRTYAMCNGRVGAVYVHHFADHAKEYQHRDKLMMHTGPGKWRLRWIDPADGREVKAEEASTTAQYLEFRLPPVKVDLAARLEKVE